MADSYSDNKKKFTRKANAVGAALMGEMGKLPPQAVDVEEVVLGALMLERDAISVVLEILEADSFYKDENKEIYAAIRSLFEKSQPIDILTVTNELRLKGKLEFVGGPLYVSELTNRVASAANIEYHARIVSEKYIMRKMIEVASQIQRDAYDEAVDVFDLLDRAERDLFSITEKNLRSSTDPMSQLITKALNQIEEIRNRTEGLSGVPSGYAALDRITSGFQRSDLIILAARPGMGKTAFVMSLARNSAVDFKKPVAIFSLEMSSVQLVMRLISSEAEINSMKLKNGDLADHEWHQLHVKIAKLSQAPIYIDDTPALNVFELRAKCRRLKAQYGIDMIIIDYLQLMAGQKEGKSSMNREQEISTISRSLKGLAKELNVPVIALSQLSRQVEQRGGAKRPILSDLRESGSIEQDADQVFFIYRPEYYGLTEDEEGRPVTGIAEIIIAKNRHGAIDTVPLRFIDKFARFADLDDFSAGGGFDDGGFSGGGGGFPTGGGGFPDGGGSFGGGGGSFGGGMPAGADEPGPNFRSITRGSKMNDDFGDEDAPF